MSNWKSCLIEFMRSLDSKKLRSDLLQEWVHIFPEEKEELYRFFIDSKQERTFIYFLSIDLKQQSEDLPWAYFLKLIIDRKIKVPDSVFNELHQHFLKQRIISNEALDTSNLLNSVKLKKRHLFLQSVAKKKQELQSSAKIAEHEGLSNLQMKYLEKLRKLSPSEFKTTHLVSDKQKDKAIEVLKRIQRRRKQSRSLNDDQHEEQQKLAERIATQSLQYLNQGKAKATDFAYMLRSMGDKKHSIEFIQQEVKSEKKDWELLDYLFYSQQYLSLLEHCRHLKRKYSGVPDSLFSISYTEAIAYWELGEKEKALYIMNQVASMRPNFKSANELLLQWKEDRFE